MSERTPLYLAFLVVALIFGLLLLREPLFGPYVALGEQAEALETKVAALEAEADLRANDLPRARALAVTFGPPLEASQRSMAAAAFYTRITDLATASGLRVNNLTPAPEVLGEDGLVRLSATLNLTGPTRAVVAFLAQVQRAPRLTGLTRLTLRRGETARGQAATDSLTVQATMQTLAPADRATRARQAAEQAKRDAARQRASGTAAAAGGLAQ